MGRSIGEPLRPSRCSRSTSASRARHSSNCTARPSGRSSEIPSNDNASCCRGSACRCSPARRWFVTLLIRTEPQRRPPLLGERGEVVTCKGEDLQTPGEASCILVQLHQFRDHLAVALRDQHQVMKANRFLDPGDGKRCELDRGLSHNCIGRTAKLPKTTPNALITADGSDCRSTRSHVTAGRSTRACSGRRSRMDGACHPVLWSRSLRLSARSVSRRTTSRR